MVIPRQTYDRCVELVREQTYANVDNIEQNCLKFLFERANGHQGTYDGDSEEERARYAANRIVESSLGDPSFPPDADYYNTPPDPTLVMIQTVIESEEGESNLKVLKLRFPHIWQTPFYKFPPPWCARTEKLEFNADSNKVVDEVSRSIVACLQQKTSFPVYKMRMDIIAPFYLVNAAGDVVLMNKTFLQQCPKLSEMSKAPTFFVCGMKDPPLGNGTSNNHADPLPHFFTSQKNAKLSYIFRLLFLIFLSYMMLDTPDYQFTASPYLKSINIHSVPIMNTVVRPINMTIRVLSSTTKALILPDLQYRACTLKTSYDRLSWIFNFIGVRSFSWWFTLATMIFTESCIIWIRSRFCVIGLLWLIYRRYIFVIFPSNSTHGANPNPHTEIINAAPAVEDEHDSEGSLQASFSRCKSRVLLPIFWSFGFVSARYDDVINRISCVSMLMDWYMKLRSKISNVWSFIQQDDWFEYQSKADKVLHEAVQRNESVAQFVYEDAQVFRYFTYRWTPVSLSVSSL